MCGVAGVLHGPSALEPAAGADLARRMGATLAHRGPDDEGVWVDPSGGVSLGHRRLAIIDLSSAGHQPMLSADGRWALSFNGEIYNFRELRRELAAADHAFRGSSDTEVLLAAIERWGVERALARIHGMFAFAAWDRRERRLTLARDRLGKKPMYWGRAGDDVVFGSELKALRLHPRFPRDVDPGALTLFLRYRYVPAPFTIYRETFKLPPGTSITFDRSAADSPIVAPRPVPYWSARAVAEAGGRDPFRGTDADAVIELESVLREAVATRLIADVPIGAFLSGGIDSSTVVALMQAVADRPVKTYSIGFDFSRGEAVHAAAVARHLGTDHTEIVVRGEDTLAVVDRLPDLFDEPFADSSQVLTAIICSMARRHVTVALSGDGGDELFCGYGRYDRGRRIWNAERHVPRALRRALALGVRVAARGAPGEGKLHSAAVDLAAATRDDIYLNRVSCWTDPAAVVVGGREPRTPLDDLVAEADLDGLEQRMMLFDLATYLPDDILVKVDRCGMAAGLELRAPLLDHRVVELALRLPLALKLRDGRTKWVLRQVLARHVPPELTERPKSGFGAPIRKWLSGPLREWSEALLDSARLEREGYLRPARIRTMWDEHVGGIRRWHNHLWPVLMFQAWLERERSPS
jgi:asparagine synthase (glutamine-hydrolysing)